MNPLPSLLYLHMSDAAGFVSHAFAIGERTVYPVFYTFILLQCPFVGFFVD